MQLNLNIFAVEDDLIHTPAEGSSGVTLFLYRMLFIQYFNRITIKGVNIQPAIDWNYLQIAQGLDPNPNFVN